MSDPDTELAKRPTHQAGSGRWRLLTNHGHVLLAVALDPDIRVQELARSIGITARAALLIIRDLEGADYIHRERVGRRTHYTVHGQRPFRHPATAAHSVDELIAVFTESPTSPPHRSAET